jgi:hypothetical protein
VKGVPEKKEKITGVWRNREWSIREISHTVLLAVEVLVLTENKKKISKTPFFNSPFLCVKFIFIISWFLHLVSHQNSSDLEVVSQ